MGKPYIWYAVRSLLVYFDLKCFAKALCFPIIISVLSVSGCGEADSDTSYESVGLEEYSEEAAEPVIEENRTLYVYVCGRVKRAGVYSVSEDSRVYELINMAGGVCEDADISAINQAMKVEDGQQIYVPSRQEMQEAAAGCSGMAAGPGAADDGLVNINSAGADELMTLTGIGASRAQAIIDYRTENGPFAKAEDIMNVAGIKEGMFSKIKDKIKVR